MIGKNNSGCLYPFLFILCALVLLAGCTGKKETEGIADDKTELQAENGLDVRKQAGTASAPVADEITPVPEDKNDPKSYFYISRDGSVGLCDYRNLTYKREEAEVSDLELEEKLEEARGNIALLEGYFLTPEDFELDDEMVRKYYDYDSYDELRSAYEELLLASKEAELEELYKDEVLEKLVDGSDFFADLTEKSSTYYVSLYSYYDALSVSRNIDIDELAMEDFGLEPTEFKRRIAQDATDLAYREAVLLAVAEAEGISVDDETYAERIGGYMESFSYTDEARFEQEYGLARIKEYMLEDMALELLMSMAKGI